jgi:antitoxin VapB
VVLSRKPESWNGLFALYGQGDVPDDFMGPADRKQPPQDRDPFKGWPFRAFSAEVDAGSA